jgi:hypothetical protein
VVKVQILTQPKNGKFGLAPANNFFFILLPWSI